MSIVSHTYYVRIRFFFFQKEVENVFLLITTHNLNLLVKYLGEKYVSCHY